MTAKTLEQEAREAAEALLNEWKSDAYLDGLAQREFRPPNVREALVASYLAAATARDKEIVGLRAKLTEAKAAIRWMHGYDEPGTEDFPICPEGKRYAWRGVSRQQFAIVREACSEPIPLPEGE